MNRSRAHRTGNEPMLVFAKINLSPTDITWMPLYVCSRSLMPLVAAIYLQCRREIKNPAYFRKQGWEKIFKVLPAYTGSIQITFSLMSNGYRG